MEKNNDLSEELKDAELQENNPKVKENKEKLVLAKSIATRGQKVAKTYAGLEDGLARIFKMCSLMFDKFVFNHKWSVLVSFILAMFTYMTVTNGWQSQGPLQYADEITVSLKSVANEEVYEISGLPETVQVIVKGEMNDVQLTKSTGGYQVIADLSSLQEGTHTINFIPSDFSNRVNVTVVPSSVEVTISKRISKQFKISYDFINTVKMDPKFILSEPIFETSDVIVRASQDTVDRISMIKALIDVRNIEGSFEQYATLVAYDNQGNKIEANMLPSSVKVNVEVTSPSKSLPITIVPVGELPNGKAIESITMDHEAITIYGSESVLNSMTSFIVNLNVSEIVADSSKVAIISLPSGVKESSISKVNLEVKLCQAESRIIKDVKISYKGLEASKYRFSVAKEDGLTDVEIIGSPDAIANIKAEDIYAYVDISNVTAGVFNLPLIAEGNNYLVKFKPLREVLEVTVVN